MMSFLPLANTFHFIHPLYLLLISFQQSLKCEINADSVCKSDISWSTPEAQFETADHPVWYQHVFTGSLCCIKVQDVSRHSLPDMSRAVADKSHLDSAYVATYDSSGGVVADVEAAHALPLTLTYNITDAASCTLRSQQSGCARSSFALRA